MSLVGGRATGAYVVNGDRVDASLQFLNHALNAVDAKGRVSVPSAFRAKLAARAKAAGGEIGLHIGLDESGDFLFAHDDVAIARIHAEIEEQISELPAAERSAARRAAQRSALGSSDIFKLDNTGRIALSGMLRDLGGIGDLAFFVGVGERFEIWSPAKALEKLDGPLVPTLRYLLKERGVAL